MPQRKREKVITVNEWIKAMKNQNFHSINMKIALSLIDEYREILKSHAIRGSPSSIAALNFIPYEILNGLEIEQK